MDFDEKARIGQASYDAFNRRDLDALFELYDPSCEWRMSHYHGWLERATYRGHEGLAEFFNLWLEPWEDFYIEIREARDLPGDRSFGIGYNRARGRASGAEVELPPVAQIVEFRAGRVLYVDNYSDISEARSAVGLMD